MATTKKVKKRIPCRMIPLHRRKRPNLKNAMLQIRFPATFVCQSSRVLCVLTSSRAASAVRLEKMRSACLACTHCHAILSCSPVSDSKLPTRVSEAENDVDSRLPSAVTLEKMCSACLHAPMPFILSCSPVSDSKLPIADSDRWARSYPLYSVYNILYLSSHFHKLNTINKTLKTLNPKSADVWLNQ